MIIAVRFYGYVNGELYEVSEDEDGRYVFYKRMAKGDKRWIIR